MNIKKVLLLSLTVIGLSFGLGAKYLVIVPDSNYYYAVRPLAQWKHKKGVPTKITTLGEIGATADSMARIKRYIINAYNTWSPRPEYILIAGSSSLIHSNSNDAYDDFYSDMDFVGSDTMEIAVGRFAANTVLQCSTMVAKTLYYERTPYMTDQTWFLKGTGLVAEDHGYYPPQGSDTVYWNDVRYSYDLWKNAGYTQIDSFSRQLGNNGANVVSAINDGRAYLIYRGQCTSTWGNYGGDPFTVNPNTCTNDQKLPVVISPSCQTMSLGSNSYQGNMFLNAGTPQNPKGAVGYCGTTNVSSGYGLARTRGMVGQGIYKAIFKEGLYRLGDALKRGKFFLDSIHPLVDYYTGVYVWNSARYHEWNLLGDPELNCWTAIPSQLTVTHDTLIYAGSQVDTVTVKRGTSPLAGALVCEMQDTTVYQYGYTNSSGQVYFSITPYAGTMSVTVTAHNYIPYEKNVIVQPGGLAHDVSVAAIYEPTGSISAGASVYPKVRVKNYGSNTETFPVTFKIGSVYTHTDTITSLAAGDTYRITYPLWTAVQGSYQIKGYTSLTTDQWRRNDTAFGSISVLLSHDVGVTAILAPRDTVSQGQSITPKAIIKNYGASAETFSATFNIGTGYTQTISSINLSSGITDTIDFPVWTPSIGSYATKCYTQLATDNNRSNDTINGSVYVSNYYQENFEASNGNFTASPSSNAWEWGTPTSGPGSAHTGTKLWATILSGNYTDNADWKLTSLKFEALQNNPILRFWQWYNTELNYDGGNVKISTDGGVTWSVIRPQAGYTGKAPSSTSGIPSESCYMGAHASWEQVTFVLPISLGQEFYLRWHFGSDVGLTYEGWYIDDISCTGFKVSAQLTHDVGVTAILAPRDTVSQGQSITPKAIIKNYGASAETFSATFNIGTGYTQTISSINLSSGITDTIDFPVWTPSIGSYATKCYTQLATDNDRGNDTVNGSVYVSNYYQENFEATNGSFTASPNSSAWEWGIPTSGPGSAHTGTKLWATVLAGNYSDTVNWKLTSREFIATSNNPTLKFWHWYNMEESPGTPGRAYDGGNVKISTDSGNTWAVIRPVSGYDGVGYTNTYGIANESCFTGTGTTWQEAQFVLPINSGQRFFLRWHFGSDIGTVYPGWYIDDVFSNGFIAYSGPINDVSTVSIQSPSGIIDSGAIINPTAVIHNYSASRVSLDVKFDINDGYTSTRSISAPPNADTTISFSSWIARFYGNFNTKCSTRYSSDQNWSNDKVTGTVHVKFHDVGAYRIVSPRGNQYAGSLSVSARIKNYYTRIASCSTRYVIRNSGGTIVFNQARYVQNLVSNDTASIDFGSYSAAAGKYYTKVYTILATDDNPANDTISDSLNVVLATPVLVSPNQAETLSTATPTFD